MCVCVVSVALFLSLSLSHFFGPWLRSLTGGEGRRMVLGLSACGLRSKSSVVFCFRRCCRLTLGLQLSFSAGKACHQDLPQEGFDLTMRTQTVCHLNLQSRSSLHPFSARAVEESKLASKRSAFQLHANHKSSSCEGAMFTCRKPSLRLQ